MREHLTGQFTPGTSILHRLDARAKFFGFLILIAATVAGRVVNGLVNALIFARGSYSMATWVAGSVVKSWPGTVIQLVFIPSIVFALMKARLIPERYPKEVPADD